MRRDPEYHPPKKTMWRKHMLRLNLYPRRIPSRLDWSRLPGFQWAALFTFDRGIFITWSLKYTSGVTPANLLAASHRSRADLFHTPTRQALVGRYIL